MQPLNVSSIEIESEPCELAEEVKLMKEATFTMEITPTKSLLYILYGRFGVSNNWLKRKGIPMRRRWEKKARIW